jgi:hypothetical protein
MQPLTGRQLHSRLVNKKSSRSRQELTGYSKANRLRDDDSFRRAQLAGCHAAADRVANCTAGWSTHSSRSSKQLTGCDRALSVLAGGHNLLDAMPPLTGSQTAQQAGQLKQQRQQSAACRLR